MNVLKLRGKMVEKEISVENLASIIGRDKSSVYRRLDNGETFTVGEVQKIKDALELTHEEASAIFFE